MNILLCTPLSLPPRSPLSPHTHTHATHTPLCFAGALQIENSEETDQGKYECVATNSQGVRYSSPANLYVRGRTRAHKHTQPTNTHAKTSTVTAVKVTSSLNYL